MAVIKWQQRDACDVAKYLLLWHKNPLLIRERMIQLYDIANLKSL